MYVVVSLLAKVDGIRGKTFLKLMSNIDFSKQNYDFNF